MSVLCLLTACCASGTIEGDIRGESKQARSLYDTTEESDEASRSRIRNEATVMRRDYELVQDPVPRAAEMKRKRRQPELRIVASPAYDLLLSLHVVFGSPLND